jgi:hypothetical protein
MRVSEETESVFKEENEEQHVLRIKMWFNLN